jgi:hypothetical protein
MGPLRCWRCVDCGAEYDSPGTEQQCGQNLPVHCRGLLEPVYGPTAQDVVDALRLVLTQDDASMDLVRELMAEAPETDDARGVDFLLDLIKSGRLKVALR